MPTLAFYTPDFLQTYFIIWPVGDAVRKLCSPYVIPLGQFGAYYRELRIAKVASTEKNKVVSHRREDLTSPYPKYKLYTSQNFQVTNINYSFIDDWEPCV